MSHQDRRSKEQIVVNRESLKQAVNSPFTAGVFRGVKARKGCQWTPRRLVVVALFWAWSKADGLKERFRGARKLAAKIFRWLPGPGETYNGFMKQLRKWHVELQLLCMGELRVLMKQDLFGPWEIAGFVVIAGDGSRIELPRTKTNEAAYSPKGKKKGSRKKRGAKGRSSRGKRWRKAKRQSAASIDKKANSPQMWLTLFWHVGTGLPWAWRTGPSDSSERQHLEEMLSELPENTLITADAGFVGYDFWSAVIAAGHRSGRDPCRLSPAGAIKAIQAVMCHYRNRPDEPRESLWRMLRHALQDDYQRTSSKTARAYPAKRKRERTGVPTIASASKSQIAAANEFRRQKPDLRLPA